MTYRDIRADAMASHAKRQHMYARGGEVHSDAKEDRALIKDMVKPQDLKKRADGGSVEGRARGGKADRPKGKTVVNVIIPPSAGAAPPMMPPHPPVMAGPPPGAMPSPGMAPHPPMAGMGPMPPPGGPPMMPPRARGGRMTGGAESGVGRLEKAEGGFKGPMIERK